MFNIQTYFSLPSYPAPLLCQSEALRWPRREVFTMMCWTSLQVRTGLRMKNNEMSLFITCLTGMAVNTLSNRHDWLNKTCMWNWKPMSNNGRIQLWPNLNQWKVSEMRWPKSFTLDSWQSLRLKMATLDLTTECLPDLTERWPHLTDRAQIN